MELLVNISHKINYVRQDYTGSINFASITDYIFSLLFTIGIFCIIFFAGNRIRVLFFTQSKFPFPHSYVNIGLGYIFIGSLIALLGMVSLISLLPFFLIFILLIACFPATTFFSSFKDAIQFLKESRTLLFRKDFFHIIVVLFITISFGRLIVPDIGVDGISYHTDYPRIYAQKFTLLIKPSGSEIFITIPQLAEMLYVIPEFFHVREASRFIHFFFYFFTITLLFAIVPKKKQTVAALLFVSSPIVIKIAPSAYGDFQWIFCWILTYVLLTHKEKLSRRTIILAGLFFGGVLGTKIWTLVFFIPIILFLWFSVKEKRDSKVITSFLFAFSAFFIALIWYTRAYILTNNPFYPNFGGHGGATVPYDIGDYLLSQFSLPMLIGKVSNLSQVSPLIFIGLFGMIFLLLRRKSIYLHKRLLLIILTFVTYIPLPAIYYVPRYLLFGFSSFLVQFDKVLTNILTKNKMWKYASFFILSIMITYYASTTLLDIPYGIGMANKNAYLTRFLSVDNSSYYDYDNKFSPWITKNDIVAVYGLTGFYYASFKYQSLDSIPMAMYDPYGSLAKYGFTKLLIKRGDAQWLCQAIQAKKCDMQKVQQLAYYDKAKQYLYLIRK